MNLLVVFPGRFHPFHLGHKASYDYLTKKYGADSVRMGLLLSAPAGNDILYDETLIEQGRNFCNKLWNAYRLLNGWEVVADSQISNDILQSNQLANQLIVVIRKNLMLNLMLNQILILLIK
jgi:valyl-tRNA synthetase